MSFLSSKTVRAVETAFGLVLQPPTVSQGEQLLRELRRGEDYELALATFVSRSPEINQRLLAMLQLQKLHTVREEQSARCLATIYYQDNEKVARIIARLLTRPQNLQWSGLLLAVHLEQAGFIQVIRWVEVAFRLLTMKEGREVVSSHSGELWDGLREAACFAGENQQLLLMVGTCGVLLLVCCLEGGSDKDGLIRQWGRVEGSFLEQSSSVFFLRQTANKLLLNYQLIFKESQMHSFITSMLHYLQTSDSLLLPYLCTTLELIQTHLTPLQPYSHEIAAAIHDYSHQTNQLKLQDPTFAQSTQPLAEDEWEVRTQTALHTLVGDLLESYEGWGGSGSSAGDLQLALLPILNYYGSADLPSLAPLLPSLLSLAATRLAHLLTQSQLTASNTNSLSQAMTCLQFLGSFRGEIAVEMIGHIGRLVGQVAADCSSLAAIAYSTLQLLAQKLESLPLGQLSDFLREHGEQLNADEWGHSLSSYHCFLALANNLQLRYHYFSLATPSDSLLRTALAAHATLARLLPQTSPSGLDFPLLYALIDLSAALLSNPRCHRKQLHEDIGVGALVVAIDKHSLLSCSAGKVVAFHRWAKGYLLGRLQEESTRWQMDEQDYAYRISLYVSQLNLAQHLEQPQQLANYRYSLSRTIAHLANSLPGGLQSLRQVEVWREAEQNGLLGSGFRE